MTRDLRAELAPYGCWDRTTETLLRRHGEPLQDRILQNREELLGLCAFIGERRVRSYLEIGIWTGGLVRALHALFQFDRIAACDHGWAERLGLRIRLPRGTRFLRADSDSAAFRRWRAALGHVDLVLIDANHAYAAVQRDHSINRAHPHRFLAYHDIAGTRQRRTDGVARFWAELDGPRLEIVRPHRELGLDHSVMGIGIWGAELRAHRGAAGGAAT